VRACEQEIYDGASFCFSVDEEDEDSLADLSVSEREDGLLHVVRGRRVDIRRTSLFSPEVTEKGSLRPLS